MILPVHVLAKARAYIDSIFTWLEKRSPAGAVAWYAALLAEIHRIAEHHAGCTLLAESSPRWNRQIYQTMFKTPHGRRYRIAFERSHSEIRILRVFGSGQRPLRRRDFPNE